MGFWLVDADVLASSRFALSPVLETVASMGKLISGDVPPWERAWLREHRTAFLARVGPIRSAARSSTMCCRDRGRPTS